MTEIVKRKPGRPPGSRNKSVMNRTKLFQDAIAKHIVHEDVVKQLKSDFFNTATTVDQRIKIASFILSFDALTAVQMVGIEVQEDLENKEAVMLSIIEKLSKSQ